MELEFDALPHAAAHGFSAIQNRSLLCNALISAILALDDVAAAAAASLVTDKDVAKRTRPPMTWRSGCTRRC